MGRMSKVKGAAFERKVKNLFRETWEIEMERSPRSGGWGKMGTGGDLIVDPIEYPYWPFYIECKNVEAWSFSHLFEGTDKSNINAWWRKAKKNAVRDNKTPLLIFTKRYAPVFVQCQYWLWEDHEKSIPELYLPDRSTILLFEDFLDYYRDGDARTYILNLRLNAPERFKGKHGKKKV